LIRLDSVSKIYPSSGAAAVDRLSLECTAGSLTALVGESGCGKTTTLKMINRLIEPTSGAILVDGRDVMRADPVMLRRRIGYVFQGIGLFPHYTIAENVAVGPSLLGWSAARIARRIDELLALVGLDPAEFRARFPRELSGGQQQRVGVARALAAEPAVLLMDEPFGAIDPITRDGLRLELDRIRHELELTIVLVTHDMTEALLLADRIAVMRNGRLIAADTPAGLLADPPDDYVRMLFEIPRHQAELVARIAAAGVAPPA
jgi:osmoprotectant transport system ATP-binding protein